MRRTKAAKSCPSLNKTSDSAQERLIVAKRKSCIPPSHSYINPSFQVQQPGFRLEYPAVAAKKESMLEDESMLSETGEQELTEVKTVDHHLKGSKKTTLPRLATEHVNEIRMRKLEKLKER